MSSFPSTLFPEFTVVSIPTRTNFRGVTSREIALFRGEQGWSEFSPFVEYDDLEAKNWLKAAIEGANRNWQNLKKEKINHKRNVKPLWINQFCRELSEVFSAVFSSAKLCLISLLFSNKAFS